MSLLDPARQEISTLLSSSADLQIGLGQRLQQVRIVRLELVSLLVLDGQQSGEFDADLVRERQSGGDIDPALDLLLEVIVGGQRERDQ